MKGGEYMAYHQRVSLLVLIDTLFIVCAFFIGYGLIFGTYMNVEYSILIAFISVLFSHFLLSMIYKLYKKAWEYASIGELISIIKIVTFSIVIAAIIHVMVVQAIPVRLMIVTWMLQLVFIGGSRFGWRIIRDHYFINHDSKRRTLIVGAGSAGTMVARQLLSNSTPELLPVAFIDDNVRKHNLDIFGVPVLGGRDKIVETVEKYNIENIVIAIPSLSKNDLYDIFQECAKTKAKTQIIPMLEDLVTGKVSVNQVRDVQVEDLLGRDPVNLDTQSISTYITNKVVLVTGAGGSIGSEICRQIGHFQPKQLILLGHGENSIYSIELELKQLFVDQSIELITEIADIQDAHKMIAIMNKYRPHVVYHAAAHKHVPLMERNPEEAVKNNIIGTKNVANAAHISGVRTFVLISSDKAVNPTSVMGATKRLAEMVIQHMDKKSRTNFITVRFGNVLGSRGSVIPLFKKQIKNGGPVTVTHPNMVRYFMTIPEASRLVIQAGCLAKGGETFVLDMGEPVKIVDLAKNLIILSGYTVEEIGIEYTGIRPGEKLFEELHNENEVYEKQIYPNIYIGKMSDIFVDEIEDIIANFEDYNRKNLAEKLVYVANQKVSKNNVVSIPS